MVCGLGISGSAFGDFIAFFSLRTVRGFWFRKWGGGPQPWFLVVYVGGRVELALEWHPATSGSENFSRWKLVPKVEGPI